MWSMYFSPAGRESLSSPATGSKPGRNTPRYSPPRPQPHLAVFIAHRFRRPHAACAAIDGRRPRRLRVVDPQRHIVHAIAVNPHLLATRGSGEPPAEPQVTS